MSVALQGSVVILHPNADDPRWCVGVWASFNYTTGKGEHLLPGDTRQRQPKPTIPRGQGPNPSTLYRTKMAQGHRITFVSSSFMYSRDSN